MPPDGRITVVTSFSSKCYHQYASRFLMSYIQNWGNVPLLVYSEDAFTDPGVHMPKSDFVLRRELLQELECFAFLEKHKNDPIAQGKERKIGSVWKTKALMAGYNFRFDAYKFCRKVFAISAAAREVNGGKLFWMDADIITKRLFPRNLLDKVLPDSSDIAYLDRGTYHSECGFVGYNLNNPDVRRFIETFAEMYSSGAVFDLPEWHDSFVFDWLRYQHPKLSWEKISHTSKSEPLDQSIVGYYLTHLKGDRKNNLFRPHAVHAVRRMR